MDKNSGSKRFCDNLYAAVGGRVPASTKFLYESKLERWHLTNDEWARALSRVIADLITNERGEVQLPSLPTIYNYLKTEKKETRGNEPIWQLFTLDGYRYAIRIEDPSLPIDLPATAIDMHLAIPNELSAENIPVPF